MKTATRRKPAATAPAQFHTLQLPLLGSEWPGEGGIFAGIRKHDGHEVAVIVPLDPASDIDVAPWKDAIARAGVFKTPAHKDYVASDRFDLALCFMNVPELFKKEWYWSATPFAGDASYAWLQGFNYGGQYRPLKVIPFRARAVRKLILR